LAAVGAASDTPMPVVSREVEANGEFLKLAFYKNAIPNV
jgi:hypothetical protein